MLAGGKVDQKTRGRTAPILLATDRGPSKGLRPGENSEKRKEGRKRQKRAFWTAAGQGTGSGGRKNRLLRNPRKDIFKKKKILREGTGRN